MMEVSRPPEYASTTLFTFDICMYLIVWLPRTDLRQPIVLPFVSPFLGELLSLAWPRESNQREGHPMTCPLRGCPALLGISSARPTRRIGYAANAACKSSSNRGLASPRNPCDARLRQRAFGCHPESLGCSRASQEKPGEARSCLSRGTRRVLRAPVFPRSTGKSRSDQTPGPPFFWVLFFGGAKKSTSPRKGETFDNNSHSGA